MNGLKFALTLGVFGCVSSWAATLGEALNAPYASWSVGGTTNLTQWTAKTNTYYQDGLAAESGAITNKQEVWIQTDVSGVTNVTFWWKVSSEPEFDEMTFYVNDFDGFGVTNISGTNLGWQFVSYPLSSSGTNILRWTYAKDISNSRGEDRGWVDEITFEPFALTLPQKLANGTAQFQLKFGAGWPCRILYSTNLATGWSQLLLTNTTAATTVITDVGATNSPHRFYRAVAP